MSTESTLLKNPALLVKSVVACLNQLIEETPASSDPLSVFNIKSAPTISVADYVTRMVKYMNASLSVYIYSLILLDRAQEYNPEFIIHKRNIHRLLLVSNLVAAKYIDDLYYKNSFYATVGGVSLKVLNQLELEFLNLINFNSHCQQVTFDSYIERLDLFAQINQQSTDKKENAETNLKRHIKTVKKQEFKPKEEESASSRASESRFKEELLKNE